MPKMACHYEHMTNPLNCTARAAASIRIRIVPALRAVRLDLPRTAVAEALAGVTAQLAEVDLAPYIDTLAQKYLAATKAEPDADRGKLATIALAELVLETYRDGVTPKHALVAA